MKTLSSHLPVEAFLPDSNDTRAAPAFAAIAVGLGLALVAGVAGWLLTRGEADEDDPPGQVEQVQTNAGAPAQVRRSQPTPQTTTGRQDQPGPTIVRPDAATFERSKPAPDAATAASGEADASEWVDPDNRRVLGRSEWMAPVPEARQQAIERELDGSEPASAHPPVMQMRRAGIDAASEVVAGCFDELRRRQQDARGRISVAFELRSAGGQARLQEPSITRNFRLDDPSFESCVVDGLSAATFATEIQGSIRVEYPFFFE